METLRFCLGALAAVVLTVVLELPVIRLSKACKNNIYIITVNVLTNVTLNLMLAMIGAFIPGIRTAFLVICEGLLIPISESMLYIVYDGNINKKKVFLFTYIANVFSYFAGGWILAFIFEEPLF